MGPGVGAQRRVCVCVCEAQPLSKRIIAFAIIQHIYSLSALLPCSLSVCVFVCVRVCVSRKGLRQLVLPRVCTCLPFEGGLLRFWTWGCPLGGGGAMKGGRGRIENLREAWSLLMMPP